MPLGVRAKFISGGTPALALVTLIAWSATAATAQSMHGMTGTMGLGPSAFVGLWTLMMAAMMLPSVAPVALSYQRVIRSARRVRLALFIGGYLAVWGCAGAIAFAVGLGADAAVEGGSGPELAATVFGLAGLYQVSPLKERCLQHCRAPVSLLMRYSSYEGRLRDLAVGAHHGAYCLGCCWALFVVLVVVGTMSLPVMIVLGSLVLLEKRWAYGVALSRFVALGCVVAAVVVLTEPSLIPGLVPTEPHRMEM